MTNITKGSNGKYVNSKWGVTFSTCIVGRVLPFILTLGVKIRNLKVDFKTGGTWRWVGQ